MTPTDLARGREVLQRATPDEWRYVPWHIEEGEAAVRAAAGWIICTTSSDANAELIAWAKNNLPALLSAAERTARLEEALQDTADALQWHYDQGCSDTMMGMRGKIDAKALRAARRALAGEK